MRFSVTESLRGSLGNEVSIETGNGGGDCGTPLPVGEAFLVFAFRDKDGKLWTGLCSGNRRLSSTGRDDEVLRQLRAATKTATGTIFGRITRGRPIWKDNEIRDTSEPMPVPGMTVKASSERFSATTKTEKDGSYQFEALPNGIYTVIPEIAKDVDFDHEYFESRYQAEIDGGRCKNISFKIEPATRIRGHVVFPPTAKTKTIEVVAIPTQMRELNQFSGKWDFTDENDRFDLWPLPPGDYFVGVNINSSPKSDAPFPPTYYPGVTDQKLAHVVHVKEGEVKDIELALREVASSRAVHFTAIGLDGKPLRKIYIQLEDLRHPGDAASYVNVDLDDDGKGTLMVFSGYSYHLHASHWVSYGNDWCARTVPIAPGTAPLEVRFLMDHRDANCQIDEIDHLKH